MAKIHHLPPEIVAKIAAGEVIERPAYAVKELIENALDAKADEMLIYIEDAGLKKIMVSDNGEGMDEEDLQECYKPHTTSKTSLDGSLLGIKTLGFRGEALASLASVSYLTIKSRLGKDPIGNQIEIQHGKLIKTSPVGMPKGTIITAENLFADIPVRKKFLKSTQTELRHIIDIVSYFAIAYPSVRFVLHHNKRTIVDLSKNQTQEERIRTIMGDHIFQFFIPFHANDSYITVSGYIAKPQQYSSTQSKQVLFVNNRKITDKVISLAVKEAYGTMLEPTSYPLFVLFLTLPFEMVDINVHPRKETISFLNNQFIFQLVKQTVTTTLQENNITFQNLSWKKIGVGTTQSFAGKLLKEIILDKEILQILPSTSIIQLHNLYICYETKNGFVMVDQHAAHERVLFEKLRNEFLQQKKEQKPFQLQNPFVLHLSTQDMLLISEHKQLLKKLGFVFTSLSNSMVVTHIPFLFQDRDPLELVQNLLENIQEDRPLKEVDKLSEAMLAFLACRAAVKAGDALQQHEITKIVKELEKTPNNATCPHGRPTHIFTSLQEIHSIFKR